jgi:hypothetical protein
MHDRPVLFFDNKDVARKATALYLVICLSVIPALSKDLPSAVPPGNWGAVASLIPGTRISVRMTFGDRMIGRFLDLDTESIRMSIDENERIYPRSDVAEVWQLRVPDRKLNGILIGMGTGAAGGIASMVAFANAKTSGPVYWDEEGSAYLLGAALVGGGIGALVGALVDASVKGDKLLYRAR